LAWLTTDDYGRKELLAGDAVGIRVHPDGTDKKVLPAIWSSTQPGVAQVEREGDRTVLRALRPGITSVSAQLDDGHTLERTFTVFDPQTPQWSRFELSQEGHAPGRFRFEVEAQYSPECRRKVTAQPALRFETSDAKVASWEAPGVLVAHADGEVTASVTGMGKTHSIPLLVEGGVAFFLESIFSFDRVLPLGIVYRLPVYVQRTDEKYRQERAPGLSVETTPAGILEIDLTPGAERMRGLKPGKVEVVARLGSQRLRAEVEVVVGEVTLSPLRPYDETFETAGRLRAFTGKELSFTTELRWEKGMLDADLNLVWTSSAPEVLAPKRYPVGTLVWCTVGEGSVTLQVECSARGLSQKIELTVQEPPEINWF
jgi:hypothetical protein